MILNYIKTISELKILDFFLRNDGEYNFTEIQEGSNIGRSINKQAVIDLEERGLLTKARKMGKSTLFKLNKINPFVEALLFVEGGI